MEMPIFVRMMGIKRLREFPISKNTKWRRENEVLDPAVDSCNVYFLIFMLPIQVLIQL